MAIRVPEAQKQPLAKLADLTDAQIEYLDRELRAASPAISPRALAEQLGPRVDLPVPDVTAVLAVLVSLAVARRNQGKSAPDLAAEVERAASVQGVDKLTASLEAVGTLKDKLTQLLTDNATLETTARAAAVFFAHEHLYVTFKRLKTHIRLR